MPIKIGLIIIIILSRSIIYLMGIGPALDDLEKRRPFPRPSRMRV
jgi:hypothetical protein